MNYILAIYFIVGYFIIYWLDGRFQRWLNERYPTVAKPVHVNILSPLLFFYAWPFILPYELLVHRMKKS